MTSIVFRRVAVLFAAIALVLAGCAQAVVLPDGRVYLLAGTAKIYDPGTGTIAIVPAPSSPRFFNTLTLLQDGRVLITGGIGGDLMGTSGSTQSASASAEIFDPATGTYTTTGSMNEARALHSATLLKDGKVLVVGGSVPNMGGGLTGGTASPGPTPPPLNSAELYDPATATFTPTGSMAEGLVTHTANLLQDGRVLIVGPAGQDAATAHMVALLYDPNSGTFSSTGAPSAFRAFQTATTLNDGRVLIAGGASASESGTESNSAPLASAEIYDPSSSTWSPAGEMSAGRVYHAASILADGKVLVAGGLDSSTGSPTGGLVSADIYDPGSGTWSPTGNMTSAKIAPTAALLQNGKVLVAGLGDTSSIGQSGGTGDMLNSGELYDPATGTFSPVQVEVAAPSPSVSPAV